MVALQEAARDAGMRGEKLELLPGSFKFRGVERTNILITSFRAPGRIHWEEE